MAIDQKTLGDLEPLFTFVADDGINTHIHPGRLRQWVLDNMPKLEIVHVELDMPTAKSFMYDNCVDMARVLKLRPTERTEPIIFCKYERPEICEMMLVDGRHRYTRAALEGKKYIEGIILEIEQWKPFEVVGLRPHTQTEIIHKPLGKKPYW